MKPDNANGINRNGQPFGENTYLTRRADLEPIPVMPQRFTWKSVGTYDDIDDAREIVKGRPLWNLKITRRGDRFEVRKGTPVNQPK